MPSKNPFLQPFSPEDVKIDIAKNNLSEPGFKIIPDNKMNIGGDMSFSTPITTDKNSFISEGIMKAAEGLGKAREVVTKVVSDVNPFGIPAAYAPAEDEQAGNIEQLKSEYNNSLLGKYNSVEDLSTKSFISGITGGIIKPETEAPKNISEKVFSSLSEIIGSVASINKIGKVFDLAAKGKAVKNLLNQYPKVAKYAYPLLKNAFSFSAYGQLDPDTQNRFQKLATDTLMSVPYAGLGFIKNIAFSVPAAFGLGFSLAKMNGASNEDAIIQGGILGVLDASGRAGGRGKQFVTGRTADRYLKAEAINTINEFSDVKITAKSTPAEIKAAYLKASRATHPDLNPNLKGDAANFRGVTEAYNFLTSKTANISPFKKTEPAKTENKLLPATTGMSEQPVAPIYREAIEKIKLENTGENDLITEAKNKIVSDLGIEPAKFQEKSMVESDLVQEAKKYNSAEEFISKINENTSIQGIVGKNNQDVIKEVNSHIEKTDTEGLDFNVKEVKIVGSRTSGLAKKTSDLDVILEYTGSAREDDLFNALNEKKLKIGNIRIDINPIKAEKTGSMKDVYKLPGEYYKKQLTDIWNKANKEKFQLSKNVDSQQFMTTEEAISEIKSFRFVKDLDIPIEVKNKILTPAGKEAFGRYSSGMIQFIENPHKSTPSHEAVHAFLDMMVSLEEKQAVLEEVKRRYNTKNYNDQQAEERLAQDFIKYRRTNEAPSSRFKKIFDSFIDFLKKIFGIKNKNVDIINQFYKDVETKRPGMFKKIEMMKRKTIGQESLRQLQQEYFQNPDKLTLKFLENPNIKNREKVSYTYLREFVNSKNLPLKQAERDLIIDVLDTQFKDEKNISIEDFSNAVKGELLPLAVIPSNSYADYGADNVKKEDLTFETHIYNSPFRHGYEGHFGGNFTSDYIIEKKGEDYVLIDKLSGEERASYPDMELAKEGREEFSQTDNLQGIYRSGLFGHARVWDNSKKGDIRYIAEIQSDVFQNLDRIKESPNEKVEWANDQIRSWELSKKNYESLLDEHIKNGDEEFAKEDREDIASIETKIKELENYRQREIEKSKKTDDSKKPKFLSYKNIWFERIIREEIRNAAMNNVKRLRFPLPYTIAHIEGFLGKGGQVPENLAVGEYLMHGNTRYVLLEKNERNENALVIPEKDIRGFYDYSQLRSDDVENEVEQLRENVNDSDELKDSYLKNYSSFSREELLKLKTEDNIRFEKEIENIAEKIIDEKYKNSQGYIDFYNDIVLGERKSNYIDDEGRIIIVENSDNIETFSMGGRSANKETFDYEKDLISQQSTVIRFYDKQVNKYLEKLRRNNLATITDENGFDWLETDIVPEDKAAVEAFQTREGIDDEADKKVYTGEEVYNSQKMVDNSVDNSVDNYSRDAMMSQEFKLTSLKIKDLIDIDPDLVSYIAGDNVAQAPSDLPIVVGYHLNGSFGVLSGYERILSKINIGDEYIQSYITDEKGVMSKKVNDALQLRRQEVHEKAMEELFKQETEILSARETDLTFSNSEKERGYQNFKDLAKRRRWLLEEATDVDVIKTRMPFENIDNLLFEGAKDIDDNQLLQIFKDRYFEEKELASIANQRTPSEIEMRKARKQSAEKIIKNNTIKNRYSIKAIIERGAGKQEPSIISKSEKELLAFKLRNIARGIKMGRSDMRDILTASFKQKTQEINDIRKAIIEFSSDLPLSERGKLLTMVVNANNKKDLMHAFFRIDSRLEAVDVNENLQEIKKTVAKVKSAISTGRSISLDYQRKIMDIISDYNISKPTNKTIAKLRSLKDFIAANPDNTVPKFYVEQIDKLTKTDTAAMNAGAIKELNDLLNRLLAQGQLKLDLQNKYDERLRRYNLDRLLESTRSLDPKGDPTEKNWNVKVDKKRKGLDFFHAFRVTDDIDGYMDYRGQNTKWQRLISHSVENAELKTKSILEGVLSQIKELQDNWSEKEQEIMEFHLLLDMGAGEQANQLANKLGWKTIPELTPNMQAAMDYLRGAFRQTEDRLVAVYEELNNKPFVKVDNYFPLKYERKKTEIPEPTVGQGINRSVKTKQGFTITRVPNVKKVPRTDVFSQFEEAIREQQYFTYVQQALMEVHSLVDTPEYIAKAGEVVSGWWADYLNGVANKGYLSRAEHSAFLRGARINLSRAILGYKLSSVVIQPLAIFDAMSYVEMRFGSIAAGKVLANFAASFINPLFAKKAIQLSPSLQMRQGGEIAIEEIESMSGNNIWDKFQKNSMFFLQALDIKTAAAVDRALFKIFKKEGLSDLEAQREADLVMNIVSASSEIADRPVSLMKGEVWRTVFTFQNFMLNRWGIIWHDLIKSGLVVGKKGDKIFGKILRKYRALIGLGILALGNATEGFIRRQLSNLFSNDKKEYSEKDFIYSFLMTVPESIPLLGGMIQGIRYGDPGLSVPLATPFENFISGMSSLATVEDEAKKQKAALKVAEAVSTIFGVAGTAQLFQVLKMSVQEEQKYAPISPSSGSFNLPKAPSVPKPPSPPKPPMPPMMKK